MQSSSPWESVLKMETLLDAFVYLKKPTIQN